MIESKRGHRKPALLPVARDLFFKKGYLGTTIEQVAKRAGFSKRTVYLYFKNKDELFLSVAREGIVLLQERLESIPVDEYPVEQSMEAVLDVYLWFAREHSDYYRMIFQDATASMIECISDELREEIKAHEKACLGVVAHIAQKAIDHGLAEGIDPWEVAVIFWGSAAGILQLSAGVSQTVFTDRPAEDLIRQAVWTIFFGLRKGGDVEKMKSR